MRNGFSAKVSHVKVPGSGLSGHRSSNAVTSGEIYAMQSAEATAGEHNGNSKPIMTSVEMHRPDSLLTNFPFQNN